MTLPRWLAQVNKRVFNPREIEKGARPVLVHVGRTSAKTYHTPLDAYPIAGGYLFTMNYGTRTDWARNIVAAGKAVLEIDDDSIDLVRPRVVPVEEGYRLLAPGTKTPPGWVGVGECLVLDRV